MGGRVHAQTWRSQGSTLGQRSYPRGYHLLLSCRLCVVSVPHSCGSMDLGYMGMGLSSVCKHCRGTYSPALASRILATCFTVGFCQACGSSVSHLPINEW